MAGRGMIGTESLFLPEQVTKSFFPLKRPFHTVFINVLPKFVSKYC